MKGHQTKIAIIFIIFALIIIGQAQRGGGSRGRSRSRSHRTGGIHGNSTRVPQKTREQIAKQFAQNIHDFFKWLGSSTMANESYLHIMQNKWFYNYIEQFICVLIFILIGLSLTLYNTFIKYRMFSNYMQTKQQPCTIPLKKIQNKIQNLKNKKWRMQFKTKQEKSQPKQVKININSIRKITNYQYNICLKGNDYIGPFTMNGTLFFYSSIMGIYLFKEYFNYVSAGQTGSFARLVYEGEEFYGSFEGTWEFPKHLENQKYSGYWKMDPIAEEE